MSTIPAAAPMSWNACCASSAPARCRRPACRVRQRRLSALFVADGWKIALDRCGGGKSQSGPAGDSPPEPRRIQQRDSRSAGARYQAGIVAAGGRFRLRLRQHRRRALGLAGAAGAVHVGGAQGQPPGGGDPSIKPAEEEFTCRGCADRQDSRTSGSATICRSIRAAALRFRYYFPVDAEYVIRVKVRSGGGDSADPHAVEVRPAD